MPVMKYDRTVNLQAVHSTMRRYRATARCRETERTRNVSKFNCGTSFKESLVALVMWMRDLVSVLMVEKMLWCCQCGHEKLN